MDDLATVWCEWAEMELRHKNYKRALDLMRRATYTPEKYNRREVLFLTCLLPSTVPSGASFLGRDRQQVGQAGHFNRYSIVAQPGNLAM